MNETQRVMLLRPRHDVAVLCYMNPPIPKMRGVPWLGERTDALQYRGLKHYPILIGEMKFIKRTVSVLAFYGCIGLN